VTIAIHPYLPFKTARPSSSMPLYSCIAFLSCKILWGAMLVAPFLRGLSHHRWGGLSRLLLQGLVVHVSENSPNMLRHPSQRPWSLASQYPPL
jgi:hypothetical protein